MTIIRLKNLKNTSCSHSNEIRDGAMTQKKVENLNELKKKYISVGEA